MKFDIITVGGATIDAFVDTGIPEIHKQMCYNAGTKIAVRDMNFFTGGGGTNTATSFAKMNLKTGFIGRLGDDENGKKIIDELKREGIIFLGQIGHKEKTGYSIILDSREKDRIVLTYRGANENLILERNRIDKIESDWFYFSSMAGKSHETQEKLADVVLKKGAKIAFNPSAHLTKKGLGFLKKLISKSYVLILNDEEARDLVGKGNFFNKLHALGPKIVVVTYGEKGSEASDGKKITKYAPPAIKVVEPTGAGDSFAAGFVAGLIKTNNLEKSLLIGSKNAEANIKKIGAKEGILSWTEAVKLSRLG